MIENVESGTNLFRFELYASKNSLRVERSYERLSDLIAKLGGILKVLMTLGYVFTNLELRYRVLKIFLNSLFKIPEKGKIIEKSSEHSISKANEDMNLQFNIFDFIKTMIRKKLKMKVEGVNAIINRGEQKLLKKIDIIYLFKKIHQFKFIKKKFFANTELKNFDYRPLLTLKTLKITKRDDFKIYKENQPQIKEKTFKKMNRNVAVLEEHHKQIFKFNKSEASFQVKIAKL